MKARKLADVGLYLLAGGVIFAVVAAMAGQVSDGATAKEAAEHYKVMTRPLFETATEAADTHLEAARQIADVEEACDNGECEPEQVTTRRTVRRKFLFRWRSRR